MSWSQLSQISNIAGNRGQRSKGLLTPAQLSNSVSSLHFEWWTWTELVSGWPLVCFCIIVIPPLFSKPANTSVPVSTFSTLSRSSSGTTWRAGCLNCLMTLTLVLQEQLRRSRLCLHTHIPSSTIWSTSTMLHLSIGFILAATLRPNLQTWYNKNPKRVGENIRNVSIPSTYTTG